MTPQRSQAYGRVMKTLAEVGPDMLRVEEQDAIRDAADTLVFAVEFERDGAARAALEAMVQLTEGLIESERWPFDTADRLLADIEDCGPGLVAGLAPSGLVGAV